MFDLDELYKKYLFYKLKRYLPFFISFSVVVTLVYIYIVLPSTVEVPRQKEVQQIVNPKPKKEKHKVINIKEVKSQVEVSKVVEPKQTHYKFFTISVRKNKEASLKRVQQKYFKLGLECKIEDQNNFLNLVCGETNSYKEYEKIKTLLDKHHIKYYLVTKKEIPIVDQQNLKKTVAVTTQKVQEKKKSAKIESNVSKALISNISHTDVDLAILKKKFLEHESYEMAIRIAKEYYAQQNYKQSLVWAKKANGLNRKKSQSWILYARSLYELGKKDKAIKILKLYKNFASSSEVDRILQGWKQHDK